MVVDKIPTRKVSEAVAEEVEKLIEKGTFQAGEKLPSVRELCEMFGVGRSAVRDAITTLSGKGIVYVKQGEGTYVYEFDPSRLFNHTLMLPSSKDIIELFQVRKILETGIAEKAAIHRSEVNLERMEECLNDQTENNWESDFQFHLTLAQSTGNEILIQFMQFISATIQKAMIDFHQYIGQKPETLKKIHQQHREIFEAIQSRKPKDAHKKMGEHLSFVEKELLESHVLQEESEQ
ncbi:FadR/GntR family transcriptional regulator [Jeotgalibacillus proteolyticus]|uniref:FadR family transcriptional regulator n=1 Tax=Jeotgalibacillus proteolyticus TaxID=2082395 RepID=A0A2S5GBE9_9BACL|nr:FadR/GntR family transcriptional regulator [Jeotgalibacillus proteolyticus]PPA70326.1 FadR family transcriptional regulator [Jeotgalibacillus proteolyticus]